MDNSMDKTANSSVFEWSYSSWPTDCKALLATLKSCRLLTHNREGPSNSQYLADHHFNSFRMHSTMALLVNEQTEQPYKPSKAIRATS